MKTKIFTGVALIAFLALTAFKPVAKPVVYTVDTQKSSITWIGKKVTGQHNGSVDLKSGSLTFNGKNLTNGSFTADMTSIKVLDGSKGLDGHLKNDDFFGVDKHPAATFQMLKIVGKGAAWTITGDLTVKGIKNSVTFPANVVWNADGTVTATADKIKIDRTKHEIKYRSKSFLGDLGDKAIDDDFEIAVKLVASKGVSAK